jgi:hypothetical protein
MLLASAPRHVGKAKPVTLQASLEESMAKNSMADAAWPASGDEVSRWRELVGKIGPCRLQLS